MTNRGIQLFLAASIIMAVAVAVGADDTFEWRYQPRPNQPASYQAPTRSLRTSRISFEDGVPRAVRSRPPAEVNA